jgi:hypothetical protein
MWPQSEEGSHPKVVTWAGRGAAGCGLLFFIAGATLLVVTGFTFKWRTVPIAVVYGGVPLVETLIPIALVARRRPALAVAALWLCALLNVFLIYNGAIGL